MAADDINDLFAMPAGPAQPMSYRQGRIVTFDQTTLQNTVSVGGTTLTDLPVLGVAEAASLTAGSVVGVMVVGSTWAIIGRMVTPNTAEATDAISQLSSWVVAASIGTQQTYNSTAYGDLGTVGPAVTVNVRATGRLLVMITSQIQWVDLDVSDGNGGACTIEMSGANTMAPAAAANQLLPTAFTQLNIVAANSLQGCYTAMAVFNGLTPGATTVTMKYLCYVAGESVDFGRRALVAITL